MAKSKRDTRNSMDLADRFSHAFYGVRQSQNFITRLKNN